MSTDISTSTEFQQKVFEKIRESIGSLLTETELKKILEVAMQKAFFEERVDTSDQWRTRTLPPLLVELVGKLLKDQVNVAIKQWITDHPNEVEKIVSEIVAKGMIGLLGQYIKEILAPSMNLMTDTLRQKGILL